MKRLALVALLALAAAFTPANGTEIAKFQAGIEAYDLGDFPTAIAAFRSLADSGDVAAAYNLGVIHSRGGTGTVDMEVAANWFRVAAERGSPAAQNRLGTMYYKGQGVTRDLSEAVSWIRRAAEQDDPIAQSNLARMYLKGEAVPQDYAAAVRWAGRASAEGPDRRRYAVGIMREPVADGIAPDPAMAETEAKPAIEPSEAATPPAVTAPKDAAPPALAAPKVAALPPVVAAPEVAAPPPAVAAPKIAAAPAPASEAEGKAAPRPEAEPEAKLETALLSVPAAKSVTGPMIQLVAAGSASAARAAWDQLSRTHAALLGDLPHRVERADLGARGVFYRLRVGPMADGVAARRLCRDLKARDVACWIAAP